ncbi:MAG: GspH/FimT family pseudopilin [Nocardioides sp.]
MTPRRSALPRACRSPRDCDGHGRGDGGFTMLEVIVTIGVAGILMAVAVSGWQGWARASAQDGLATELRGVLRSAQQRAVTEGSSTCVLFDADAESWQVFRGRCDSSTKQRIEGPVGVEDGLDLHAPLFTVSAESTSSGVTFSPRGTATPGSVRLRRDGSDTVVTIRVEGLTGRVTEG